MVDPVFWLSLSALTLTASVAVFLAILIPAIQELGRTARSVEKLLDTLNRELPPTLDALRATSEELSSLTEDVGDGVESAKQIVQQVDRSLDATEKQFMQARITSQSAIAGLKAAWQTFFSPLAEPRSSSSVPHSQPKESSNPATEAKSDADQNGQSAQRAIADELTQIDQKLSEM